jgi:hypothetical protein
VFTAPSPVGNPPVNSINTGAESRVVATDNRFEAFVPTLDPQALTPSYIARYESYDGINWTGDLTIGMGSFGPANNNGGGPNVFFAPLPTAQGYSNGLWTIAFQLNNGGFNNAAICTVDRGCGYISDANHQFLVGTSVSGDRGYWLSYYTYNGVPGVTPLKTTAIYFPPGQGGISAFTNPSVDQTSWTTFVPRCMDPCYAAGDYHTMASNQYAGAATPFINSGSGRLNDLFSTFVVDPQGLANVPNFKPNFVAILPGASVANIAHPVPPGSVGLPPGLRSLGLSTIK